MKFQFKKITQYLHPDFEALKQESLQEGYNFLVRLEKEWQSGENNFSKPGEGLYQLTHQDELIAIAGISIDPYFDNQEIGRLRRFYVKPTMRGKKIGQTLLLHILGQHQHFFKEIHLYTDNPLASSFYLKNGFEVFSIHKKVTHRLIVRD